jgi:hypothetical protein
MSPSKFDGILVGRLHGDKQRAVAAVAAIAE